MNVLKLLYVPLTLIVHLAFFYLVYHDLKYKPTEFYIFIVLSEFFQEMHA
ncbi:Hypothetical Protein U712_10655 [Bacillus subtilis PY79]|nr:Hypothetical Protein U712_10655 [Bacillus subtilis PY79]AKN14196.1 hypothetical protein ABU16_3120 [Bacillus subtilis]KZD85167.1 hypothetical protein B4417_1242 [Bacillus subtilis]